MVELEHSFPCSVCGTICSSLMGFVTWVQPVSMHYWDGKKKKEWMTAENGWVQGKTDDLLCVWYTYDWIKTQTIFIGSIKSLFTFYKVRSMEHHLGAVKGASMKVKEYEAYFQIRILLMCRSEYF